MAEWTAIDLPSGRRASGEMCLRMQRDGVFTLSASAFERLGRPERVEFLRNGTDACVGIRGTTNTDASRKIEKRRRTVQAMGAVLLAFRKQPPRAPVSLPYRMDGDILVLDISALPDAEAVS